jgi:hypothetical protein
VQAVCRSGDWCAIREETGELCVGARLRPRKVVAHLRAGCLRVVHAEALARALVSESAAAPGSGVFWTCQQWRLCGEGEGVTERGAEPPV